MKKIHIAAPKTDIDPILELSFNRVNEGYFYNLLEKTNLKWAYPSVSRLGSYEYGSDTIMINKLLGNADQEMLDYVMYHEMLHKKYKFHNKNGRNHHHTQEFKKSEKAFENSSLMEDQISKLIRKLRSKSIFKFNF